SDLVPESQLDPAVLVRFRERLDYLTMDFRRGEDYAALAEKVSPDIPLIAYFATPASVYGAICEHLAAAGLAEQTRVVLEKPIGHELAAAPAAYAGSCPYVTG